MLYFSANRRAIKITKPEIIAAKKTPIFRCSNRMKNNEPSHETVVYKGLENTNGGSLHKISLKIPPMIPVITPIKLATNSGVSNIKATSVPAIPNVARPAASGIRKNRGEITVNRAVMNTTMALPKEAIKQHIPK